MCIKYFNLYCHVALQKSWTTYNAGKFSMLSQHLLLSLSFAELMVGHDISFPFNLHFLDCYWHWGSFHFIAGYVYTFLLSFHILCPQPTFLLRFLLLICKNDILSIHPLSFITHVANTFLDHLFSYSSYWIFYLLVQSTTFVIY